MRSLPKPDTREQTHIPSFDKQSMAAIAVDHPVGMHRVVAELTLPCQVGICRVSRNDEEKKYRYFPNNCYSCGYTTNPIEHVHFWFVM